MRVWPVYGARSFTEIFILINRTNSQTLFEIDTTDYNHSLTTARITHDTESYRFKTPSIAGSSY